MAFPPNYNQERNNRARTKARKALDKQQEREEKAAQRKRERDAEEPQVASQTPNAENE
jgi:hypothetical protein